MNVLIKGESSEKPATPAEPPLDDGVDAIPLISSLVNTLLKNGKTECNISEPSQGNTKMLLNESKTGVRKKHWTQTPEGRKRISAIMRERHSKKRFGVARDTHGNKSRGLTIEVYTLARQLRRATKESIMSNAGEVSDLEIVALQLCKALLK